MEKVEQIKALKERLSEFKDNLDAHNIEDFKNLRKEISEALNDEERVRFNKINFYTIQENYISLDSDDLPF